LNQKHKFYLTEETEALNEMEPVELSDNLIKHQLKLALMEMNGGNHDADFDNLVAEYKHIGLLPLNSIGEAALKSIEVDISALRTKYINQKGNIEAQTHTQSIHFESGYILIGDTVVFEKNQIKFCPSSINSAPKYIAEAWVRHLFASVALSGISTVLLMQEGNDYIFPPLLPADAKDMLDNLCKYYVDGIQRLIAYDPAFKIETNFNKYIEGVYLDKYASAAYNFGLFDEKKMQSDCRLLNEYLFDKI
jgi:hypothetical protein